MKGQYQEQIQRMIRGYRKLPKKMILRKVDPRTIDNIYHYFQDCYHLKDWIENDLSLSQNVRNKVEDFVENSRYIKIAGDFANATKHLRLTRRSRVDRDICLEQINIFYPDGKKAKMPAIAFNEEATTVKLLGDKIFWEWNKFLKENRMVRIVKKTDN